jgi:hypothetical protein
VAPFTAGAADLPDTEAERAEGRAYADALLDRIGAGASSPEELATLLQFLHAGSLLHGACAVLFLALAAGRSAGARQ